MSTEDIIKFVKQNKFGIAKYNIKHESKNKWNSGVVALEVSFQDKGEFFFDSTRQIHSEVDAIWDLRCSFTKSSKSMYSHEVVSLTPVEFN